MKKLFFIAIVATSLFACQTTTKPAFDLANAKKEIEAANQEISELLAKGDSVGMVGAYSSDGAAMVANSPAIKDKNQLKSIWNSFVQSGNTNLKLNTMEVWGDENYISEEGTYELKTKEGNQVDNGKYIVIWKKENGKWKLHRDMSSSDLPLAPKGN